ncbi:8-oxo-dGTP diphosphatase [Fibrobacter sp. UWH9]|uniref:(deoxy)nucleoside triphosphate pyrophosphohydrolase n=1 Tax=Fibrobacter sp. UWH9 TaxID=1896213 RepID=UPI00090EF21B|nr:(deoxy)nucleoside triphosphate pyrophosphohydrolase [Fibrobacter sp. UWH9]MCQ2089845.1 (deoxy)nucleoside triphosphate pyrophosphohydrolase [Fibrobacter sp.]SHH55488.1 8-oxo-dGTP diphosphatase [Fibrobacter sp. UWH9]
MKTIEVVAGVIKDGNKIFATQRGYGDFKGGWEFPGGKMEPGETPQQALARELKEELTVDVSVEDFICTVEYDYPNFHLTMHCFYCTVIGGELKLLEHEAAKWLEKENIRSVDWLPADIAVVEALEKN